MKNHKDEFDEFLTGEFKKSAEKEEESVQNDASLCMPEGVREALHARIEEQIREMEREKVLSQLPEDDRHAWEIGKKILKEQEEKAENGSEAFKATQNEEAAGEDTEDSKKKVKTVRRKRSWRLYVALAAALVLVMAIGMTSIGGPERIVRLMKQAVGDREVEKVNSGDDNLTIVEHDEEKAYEEVNDAFGVFPVKIGLGPKGMKFDRMELDQKLQVAELIYNYNDLTIAYFINASYKDSSWGVDVEDKVVDNYTETVQGCLIEIKIYEVQKTKVEKCSASFQYNGLEYFLVGTMDSSEFEIIIKNLRFSK